MNFTTKNDLEKYLKSYEYLKHELEEIEANQLPHTPVSSTGGPHSQSRARTMSYAILLDKRDEIVKKMKEIMKIINVISDPLAKAVIESKYILLLAPDEIARQYDRSESTIKKHYRRGINEIMEKCSAQM